MHTKSKSQGTVMITMLYIMIVGMLITTGAAYALIANTQSTTVYEAGTHAQAVAESGLENGLLRLIRDPDYTGETIDFGSGQTAVVTVTSVSGTVVTSTGTVGIISRQMEARIHYNEGVLVIDSWKELP
jgi:hypothetical protein